MAPRGFLPTHVTRTTPLQSTARSARGTLSSHTRMDRTHHANSPLPIWEGRGVGSHPNLLPILFPNHILYDG